jgi:ABC-type branched-subunit amino acid transport system ATPase component
LAPFTVQRLNGPPPLIRRLAERLGGPGSKSRPPSTNPSLVEGLTPPNSSAFQPNVPRVRSLVESDPGVRVDNLTIRYGGATVVTQLTLVAPMSRVTGLIGPNGAGKTSTFNAISGLLRPDSGRIFLHGQDLTAMSPSARARRGLGRTFQRVDLFSSMSVRENIALGCEAAIAGVNPMTQIFGSPRQANIEGRVQDAIELTGIEGFCDRPVTEISSGQKRLVELARALAGPFDMILLDEPSSGLDRFETEGFGRILLEATRERQVGLLIVEHDMTLIRQVCDSVYVLDFGCLVFEGTPGAMLESDIVRSAYLGTRVDVSSQT